MESETGAKITILGRGRFRRDGRGVDEPLHAYVTSTNPEAVKKAVDKIRNIIKEAMDAPEGQNPDFDVNDKVMIPQEEHPEINLVGLLVGPCGNILKCK